MAQESVEWGDGPAYKQVAERLRQKIRNERLGPGDTLPSLDEIKQGYGVSITVARLAVKELKTEGLIKVVPGKGNLVADPNAVDKSEQAMRLIGTLVERVDTLADRLAAVESQLAQRGPSAAQGPRSGRRGRQ